MTRELQVELIDRFGLLPPAAKSLMHIAQIKQRAKSLGIEKIDAADAGGYLVFGPDSNIDPVSLIQLVQNNSTVYRLQGSHRLRFHQDLGDPQTRFEAVEKLLEALKTT